MPIIRSHLEVQFLKQSRAQMTVLQETQEIDAGAVVVETDDPKNPMLTLQVADPLLEMKVQTETEEIEINLVLLENQKQNKKT